MISHTSNVISAKGLILSQDAAVTDATLTVDQESSGKVIILDRAAGVTVTLPLATGSGNQFEFLIKTTASGGSYVVQVADATDVMTGYAILGSDTGNAALLFATAATSDTVTLNGTSTGGIAGAKVVVRDVAENLYQVEVVSNASGTEATPFSAAV